MLAAIVRRSTYASLVFLALLLGVVASQAVADNLHADGACDYQSWVDKTGLNSIWWKARTACHDHVAQDFQHTIRLQAFDWSTGTWETIPAPLFAGSSSTWWVWSIADSREWDVDDYLGVLCYRTIVRHYVVEWAKEAYSDATGFSPTYVCY